MIRYISGMITPEIKYLLAKLSQEFFMEAEKRACEADGLSNAKLLYSIANALQNVSRHDD